MLRVTAHTLPGCGVPEAERARATLELSALGDFDPGNESAEVLSAERGGVALKFPADTQAVLGRLSAETGSFLGYAERRGDSSLDLLLWPERESCTLANSGYPGRGGGQALGFDPDSSALLVAGGNDALETDALVGALYFDAATGAQKRGNADGGGLAVPRAFASATAFGDGFLVAGGQRPFEGANEDDLELYASAEVFDREQGAFASEPIALQGARTRHAAVTLADGRTLLVGGRTKVGDSFAQYQLEIVDPKTRRATLGDVIAPRIAPTVVELSDGRWFVGGGTQSNGSLTVPVGEWLGADAHREPTTLSDAVEPRFERAFVAMPGGGLLAVGGCEDRPAGSTEEAEACKRCSSGCTPLSGFDGWWIDAQGDARPISLEGIDAPRPRLLPGSDGSPWLVAATARAPQIPRLFRFNPWSARFELSNVPQELPLPPPGQTAPLALGPDTFVWIDERDDEAALLGLKLAERSRYARDVALVLSFDPTDPTRPQHLVPSRAVRDDEASYDGALTLTDPDLIVTVADTEYADVTLQLRVAGNGLPRVFLGDTELGGDACPWPDGDGNERPTVERRGTRAVLRHHGAISAPCEVEAGRLSLGLAAGPRGSVVLELEIARD